MILDYGVRQGDIVTIPITWANFFKQLPDGQTCSGTVNLVNGPVTTLDTEYGQIQIATPTVMGWQIDAKYPKETT